MDQHGGHDLPDNRRDAAPVLGVLGGEAVGRLSYRINDACTASGLGRTTLYKLAGEGRLRLIKIGGRTLVEASSLRSLICGSDSEGPQPMPQHNGTSNS